MLPNIASLRFLFIALFFLVVNSGCNKKNHTLRVGDKAPDLAVVDLEGRTIKLDRFLGRVVVLSFWGKGCNYCTQELLEMESIYQKHQDLDLVILGINMGNSRDYVMSFRRRLNISYPLPLDLLMITTEKYDVVAMPTTYILDKQGRVSGKILGETTEALLEGKLLSLL